jgi:hypothetical protein
MSENSSLLAQSANPSLMMETAFLQWSVVLREEKY